MDGEHASAAPEAGVSPAASARSLLEDGEGLSGLRARVRQAELGAAVGAALTRRAPLAVQLQQCTEAIVANLDAAFARVWTFDEGAGLLELQASAGLYTHLNGRHSRVPLGVLKIGRIALNRAPHLTNAVLDDPDVSDKDWARREGIVAFAGYPLVVDERLTGVLALFARHPLDEATIRALGSVAHTIALGIERAWADTQRTGLFVREQAALALADAERARLRGLLMQAPAIMCWLRGPDHIFELANPRLLDLAGGRALIGRPLREALPELAGQGFYEVLDRVYSTGEPFLGSEVHIALDRSGRGTAEEGIFNFVYQATRDARGAVDGILIHAVEVTEQVGARQSLEQMAGQLRGHLSLMEAMTASLGEGVYALDREGQLTLMNPAAKGLLGWSADDLSGQEMHAVIHGHHGDGIQVEGELCPLLSAVRSGASLHVDDDLFMAKDGTLLPVAYTVSPMVLERQVVGAVLAFHDISAQKSIERAREEFLLTVAHDLKTPLTSILGNAQLAQRRLARMDMPRMGSVGDSLGRIEAATVQMVTQIDELVDVTRLRLGGHLELDRHPTDLVGLARAVVGQHEGLTEHRLIVEAGMSSLQGNVDAVRLKRVVANLVGNAIKYSPAGGTIIVELGHEESVDGPWALIAVRDQGMGIPQDDLPHIFTRFHRSAAVVGRIMGTGVGLASVQQIVEAHGGSVTVESEEGVGSTFTVRLPLW